MAEWFDAGLAAGGRPKTLANWVLNDLFRLINERGRTIGDIPVTPAALVDLLALVERGTINQASARDVLTEMVDSGRDPTTIIEAHDLAQISDETALAAVIDQLIADNPGPVANFRGGKESLMGWFVGQVMRATRGQANPALVNKLLRERLVNENSSP